jgi:ubiquinone/menaquinone biosynthesis C-methylase UbiE
VVEAIERGIERVSRLLVELAAIKPGSRVVDIATGIEEPALNVTQQADKRGHVLATPLCRP